MPSGNETLSQKTGTSASGDAGQPEEQKYSLTGFCIMCSWHFLMLFSAALNLSSPPFEGRHFWLQFSLYAALAVTYGILSVMPDKLINRLFRRSAKRWNLVNICIALLATFASLLVAFSGGTPLPWQIFCYVLLGFGGAWLIFPWLEMPKHDASGAYGYRNLAFNMGIGSVLAVFISFLQSPLLSIATCLLPLLSNGMLILRNKNEKDAHPDNNRPKDAEGRPRLGELISQNVHFIVYGLAFGICQGIFATGHSITFVLNTGWPILGAALSAVVVIFMPLKYLRKNGIFTLQPASTSFLFAGLFLMLFFTISTASGTDQARVVGQYIAQILALAGFNIVEFGFMVFSFAWAKKLKTDFTFYVGINRVSLYLGLATGLFCGYSAHYFFGQDVGVLILGVGIVVLLLTIMELPYFDELIPYRQVTLGEDGKTDEEAGKEEQAEPISDETAAELWEDHITKIAEEHDLSQRETEVFRYLARGRNASYIQQELWISIHTVKTHIANIYRKLDVHSMQEVLDMVELAEYTHESDQQKGRGNGKGSDETKA